MSGQSIFTHICVRRKHIGGITGSENTLGEGPREDLTSYRSRQDIINIPRSWDLSQVTAEQNLISDWRHSAIEIAPPKTTAAVGAWTRLFTALIPRGASIDRRLLLTVLRTSESEVYSNPPSSSPISPRGAISSRPLTLADTYALTACPLLDASAIWYLNLTGHPHLPISGYRMSRDNPPGTIVSISQEARVLLAQEGDCFKRETTSEH
jgi:hypothetical protein